MKKIILFITTILYLFLGTETTKAQDGFFSNAKTLEKGTIAIGLQPVNFTQKEANGEMMMIVRGAYGLTNRLTGHVKAGFFQDDIHSKYLGVHLEYNLVSEPNSLFSAAFLAGVYHQRENGLKFGLNISRDFQPVSIYTGLNYQIFSFRNGELYTYILPVGFDYHVENAPVDLMFEANFALNDNSEYLESMSFGARIYLN